MRTRKRIAVGLLALTLGLGGAACATKSEVAEVREYLVQVRAYLVLLQQAIVANTPGGQDPGTPPPLPCAEWPASKCP